MASAVVLTYEGRGLTFFWDEWYFIQFRAGHHLNIFLSPHGDHLIAVPVLVFKTLFRTVGLEDYLPYRLVGIGVHLACAVLLYVIACRRVGKAAALAPVVIVLFLGPAWMDLLWPIQIAYTGAIAAGLGMLLALERRDRVGNFLASASLIISVACSAIGLAFVVVAAIELLFRPTRWRDAWVVAVPAVLYGGWYVHYSQSQFVSANLERAPEYVVKMAGAGIAAVGGIEISWAPVLVLALPVAFTIRLVSRGVPASIYPVAAGALAYGVMVALGRAQYDDPWHHPYANRYIYPSAVFVLLILLELGRGIELGRRGIAALAAGTAVVVALNTASLRDGGRVMRAAHENTRPILTALELAWGIVDPLFSVNDVSKGRVPVIAGFYFNAVDRWGSPADRPDELPERPENARAVADRVLAKALRMTLSPASREPTPGVPPVVLRSIDGAMSFRRGCLVFQPRTPKASVDLRVPTSGLVVSADGGATVNVRLRRFADRFTVLLAPLAGGAAAALRIPRDAASAPWQARLSSQRGFTACAEREP